MAFLPRLFKKMTLPDIILCDNVLAYFDGYRYLGFEICNVLTKSDDLEIHHHSPVSSCVPELIR